MKSRERRFLPSGILVKEKICTPEHSSDLSMAGEPPFTRWVPQYVPGLVKMTEAARRKESDVISVHKLDRFTRDDYEHVVSERELERLDIRLESISEPLDVDSPAGYLSRRIIQVMEKC